MLSGFWIYGPKSRYQLRIELKYGCIWRNYILWSFWSRSKISTYLRRSPTSRMSSSFLSSLNSRCHVCSSQVTSLIICWFPTGRDWRTSFPYILWRYNPMLAILSLAMFSYFLGYRIRNEEQDHFKLTSIKYESRTFKFIWQRIFLKFLLSWSKYSIPLHVAEATYF